MLEGYYGLLNIGEDLPDQEGWRMNVCLEALETFPLDAQLLCGMGGYLLQDNRLELAARSYRLAWEHGQIDPFSWHQPEILAVAAECLGQIYRLQGHLPWARDLLKQALEQFPDSPRLAEQLAEVEPSALTAFRIGVRDVRATC